MSTSGAVDRAGRPQQNCRLGCHYLHHSPGPADKFDHVAVMGNGRLPEWDSEFEGLGVLNRADK